MEKQVPKLGQEFGPSPGLRRLFYVYLLSGAVFALLVWIMPFALFAPLPLTGACLAILLIAFLLMAYWIGRYWGTIRYTLTRDDMTWRRGVWFRNTGIVPYNRITNIDITQGPLSRSFGIASLKIQTAGYSGPNQRSSEIRLDGITEFEELRELIMGLVKGKAPVAVESYDDPGAKGGDVLGELVKIRKLLEKKR